MGDRAQGIWEAGLNVSIGVTCYNNGENIGHLLKDIERQVLNGDNRIADTIVVASGCTDNTIARTSASSQCGPIQGSASALYTSTRPVSESAAHPPEAEVRIGYLRADLCSD